MSGTIKLIRVYYISRVRHRATTKYAFEFCNKLQTGLFSGSNRLQNMTKNVLNFSKNYM